MRRLAWALVGAVIVLVRGWPDSADNPPEGGLGGDNGPLPGWDGATISDYGKQLPCLSNAQIDALRDDR